MKHQDIENKQLEQYSINTSNECKFKLLLRFTNNCFIYFYYYYTTLIGVKWYLIVILISNSLITNDFEHFLCAYWVVVCHLWTNVNSDPLHILNWLFVFLFLSCTYFVFILQSNFRFRFCKYFLPFYKSSFLLKHRSFLLFLWLLVLLESYLRRFCQTPIMKFYILLKKFMCFPLTFL